MIPAGWRLRVPSPDEAKGVPLHYMTGRVTPSHKQQLFKDTHKNTTTYQCTRDILNYSPSVQSHVKTSSQQRCRSIAHTPSDVVHQLHRFQAQGVCILLRRGLGVDTHDVLRTRRSNKTPVRNKCVPRCSDGVSKFLLSPMISFM